MCLRTPKKLCGIIRTWVVDRRKWQKQTSFFKKKEEVYYSHVLFGPFLYGLNIEYLKSQLWCPEVHFHWSLGKISYSKILIVHFSLVSLLVPPTYFFCHENTTNFKSNATQVKGINRKKEKNVKLNNSEKWQTFDLR